MHRMLIAITTALVVLTGAGGLWAQSESLMTARVTAAAPLLGDSVPGAERLGTVQAGDHMTIYPEMSSDDYFFALVESGPCAKNYGFVPTNHVQMVDATFGDVPQNHWAGEALRRLEREGIITGDDNGFRGSEAVTRYELAMVLDRHLDKLQQYKGQVMAAIEAVPYDHSLNNAEAGKLDRLIAHLEGLESTEKKLTSEVTDLRTQVTRNSTRLEVVEEATAMHNDSIAKMGDQIAALQHATGGDVVMRELKNLQKRMSDLETRGAPTPSLQQNLDVKSLKDELRDLKQRLERVEQSNQIAAVPPAAIEPPAEQASAEFDISASDFDIEGIEDDTPALEPPPDALKRKAEKAHDALRAALRKGLIIRRHPLDGAPAETAQAPVAPKAGQPNQLLVKALTKQISEISESLQTIDSRINDIEQGALD